MSKTEDWAEDRKKLIKLYKAKGIVKCELKFPGCWYNNALGFAHKHKRHFYLDCPEDLGKFEETILACNPCHEKIEYDSDLTEKMFKKLR